MDLDILNFMSLTSELRESLHFRGIFNRYLKLPPIEGSYTAEPVFHPTQYLSTDQSLFLHDRNDSLFSICVDHGIRTLIARNSKSVDYGSDFFHTFMSRLQTIDERILIHRAIADYLSFIKGNDANLDSMVSAFFRLGFTDANFRYPSLIKIIETDFPNNRRREIHDLFSSIPPTLLVGDHCSLNPDFGFASGAIGAQVVIFC
jgi:hypothetical protein